MRKQGVFYAMSIALLPCSSGPSSAAPHADEIDTYAFVLAVAQVASDQCSGMLINRPMLDAMRTYFHVGAEDEAAVHSSGRATAQRMAGAMATMEKQAWCDAAYRAYGPEGTVLPKLMLRTQHER